jgi:hypothetical protein
VFAYIAIATVLFCFAFVRAIGTVNRRYEGALALCLTLFAGAISVLRWDTGTDWATYLHMFETLNTLEAAQSQSWWGPGYAYPAVLINNIGGNYTTFLVCLGLVLFAAKFHALTKSCAAPLVAIFVLFCVNFFDVFFVRESIAVVFFWLFAFYYFQKRYLLTFATALVAVLFHYSAALPIAIVLAVGRFSWWRVLLLVGGAAGAVFIVLTTDNIGDLVGIASLSSYLGTDYIEEKASGLSTTLRAYLKLGFWVAVILMGFISFRRDSESTVTGDWNSFCLRCAMGIVIAAAVLLPISEIFARIPSYSLPLFAVILSNYKLRMDRLSVGGAAYLLILLLLFVQLSFLYSAYPDEYSHFGTILNQ